MIDGPKGPTKKRARNAAERRQLRAADLQHYVQAAGRKARGNGHDPNDRAINRATTRAIRHMEAAAFDALLRLGEDEDAA